MIANFMTALSIIDGVNKKAQADKAAADAIAAGNSNAELAELEGAERVRRYELGQRRLQGQMVMSYAKSGVMLQGTPLDVLAEAANEADLEVSFMKDQTARTAAARRLGANAQADSLRSEGTSLLIAGIGKGLQTAYDNNLWDFG